MILFLDFDGVLHPDPCPEEDALFCRRPRFEAVMREFSAVEVVISSTWREKRTLDQLQALFAHDIGERIIGVTPYWRDLPELHDVIGRYPRQVELEGWLRQSGRVSETWVAIDDRPYLFRPFLKNLVICDPATGIDEQAENVLRSKLSV